MGNLFSYPRVSRILGKDSYRVDHLPDMSLRVF